MQRIKNIVRRVGGQAATVATATKVWLTKTDKERWKKVSQEIPPWDDRNRIIASFIPEKSSVLDIGCGAQTLKTHLKPGCEYQPSDVIQSSPEVIHCDFNSGVYPALPKKYDYVVCSGVFEYMRDPEKFMSEVRNYGRKIIFTFNPLNPEHPRIRRLANGWVNHLTEPQVQQLFSSHALDWKLLKRRNPSPIAEEVIYELTPKPL